ncbi:MAG TPA: hypothetical protein PK892_13705, partial [Bacteroidales bacterium]|nr:hypothetical protein [Bacteroidales bacterium]
ILAVLVLVLFGTVSYAQWATSGNNIYNTNTGNVGIGTTTPTFKLHVSTSEVASLVAQSSVTAQATDRAIGFFRMVNSANNETYNIAFRKFGGVFQCLQSANVGGNTVNVSLFDYSNKSLKFGGNGLSDVLFSNSGYVGIGTTVAPAAGVKLAVNGKVNCKEVEVTLTGWSDKVFDKNYNLLPLNEVESFINANNHLPGVPSEKEVMSKPANLGEMDALLLQKIEELTLYMIDLKKENDLLKAKINSLEK